MTLTVPAQGQWARPSHSVNNLIEGWLPAQASVAATQAWAVQYRVIYCPVRVARRVVVRELGWLAASTAAGNCDVGIYDAAGTRLVSTTSTANTTVSAIRAIDVTDTTLGPGLYYLALNNDTTTDTFLSISYSAPLPAAYGYLTETLGSVTLPATASWAVNNALGFIPGVFAWLVTEIT